MIEKIVRDKILEVAKENGDELEYLSPQYLWEYVLKHGEQFASFFGGLYGEGDYVQTFTLPLKKYCPQCEINLLKLARSRELKPTKYDNKIVLTFHQDWLGGDIWHLHKIEWGNYGE